MSTRSLMPVVLVAGTLIAAGPAAAQSPTDNPAPGVQPGACTDSYKPTSTIAKRALRRAARSRVVRGVSADQGCGVDRVLVSIARKGDGKCRLVRGKRLARKTSCSHRHWMAVNGTTSWSYRLAKRLPAGKYIVRTRTRDFAGNVQNSGAHKLRLR
jgi:hypothetical protein